MNVREAILAAADHIERHPGQFTFWSCSVPDGCGAPGCAIGWIGHFMGAEHSAIGFRVAVKKLGYGESEMLFYDRMDEIAGSRAWKQSAAACANTMRLYADKYHPAESPAVPVGYPDWMAIARGDVKCVEAP